MAGSHIILSPNDVAGQQRGLRRAVNAAMTGALAANTRTNNTLLANANGALGAIDGVTPNVGDSLLVKNEATGANNGIYVLDVAGDGSTKWQMTRRSDASDANTLIQDLFVFVLAGTTLKDSEWVLVAASAVVVNTTSIAFTRIDAGGGAAPTGAAGGDLAGTYPNPTVAGISAATSPLALGSQTITTTGAAALGALTLTGNFSWTKAVASPTVTHTAQTTDVATTALTITSQGPFASATGTNRNPGNLVLTVPAKAAGGAAGKISLSVDGAEIASFSASLGAGVLHSSAGQVVTSSTIVDADVSGSAAIAASKLDLTSPGSIGTTAAGAGAFTTLTGSTAIKAGPGTYAAAGAIRFGKPSDGTALINFNKNDGSADSTILFVDTSNNIVFGDAATASMHCFAAGTLTLNNGSAANLQLTSTILEIATPTFQFDRAVASATFKIRDHQEDTAAATLSIKGQTPWASATGTNRNSGSLSILIPAPTAGGTAGTIDLNVNGASVIKAGSATVGFYGVTPVARPAALTQTYATTTRTHANDTATDMVTTASTNVAPFGFATAAQADAIATKFNALRVDVDNLKQFVNSLVDDMQAYGLEQ